MSRLTPVSWRELVQRMRRLGFKGPYEGSKHPYMIRGEVVVTLPNPHRTEIGVDLLQRILKEAGVNRQEWLAGE